MNITSEVLLNSLTDMIAEKVLKGLAEQNTCRTRPDNGLLSVADVAARLGRTPTSVRHLIAQGQLPSVRSDRRVFVDSADLDHFIDMHKRRN